MPTSGLLIFIDLAVGSISVTGLACSGRFSSRRVREYRSRCSHSSGVYSHQPSSTEVVEDPCRRSRAHASQVVPGRMGIGGPGGEAALLVSGFTSVKNRAIPAG